MCGGRGDQRGAQKNMHGWEEAWECAWRYHSPTLPVHTRICGVNLTSHHAGVRQDVGVTDAHKVTRERPEGRGRTRLAGVRAIRGHAREGRRTRGWPEQPGLRYTPEDLTPLPADTRPLLALFPDPHTHTHAAAPHQCCCEDPVSWLSVNVTAISGHHPIRPGALPWLSHSRQYWPLPTASCEAEGGRRRRGSGK